MVPSTGRWRPQLYRGLMSSAVILIGSRLVMSSIGVSLGIPLGPAARWRGGDYKRLLHSARSGDSGTKRSLACPQPRDQCLDVGADFRPVSAHFGEFGLGDEVVEAAQETRPLLHPSPPFVDVGPAGGPGF